MPILGIMASQMTGHLTPVLPVTSGLRIWYDASDTTTITSSSSRVSAITNKATGYTFTLSQGTTANMPLVVASGQNGKQILQFANSRTDILVNSSATPMDGATNLTIFFAGKTTSTVNGYKFEFGTNNGVGGFPLLYQLSNKNYFETGSGTNGITGTSDYNGVANIQFIQATGSTGGTIQKTITSTTETNTAGGANFTVGGGSTWSSSLGSSAAGVGTDLNFFEVVVYNRTLSTPEYNSVVAYLKTKWGI